MLNISPNKIDVPASPKHLGTLHKAARKAGISIFLRLTGIFFALSILLMFLPWTQNIQSRGFVTTLTPDQKPQTIHSIIPGRIEKWFVREGDFVEKGDTILFLSEIKDEYFDPNLLERTQEQLAAKEMSVDAYMQKVKSLDQQIDALNQTGKIKLEQAKNKLKQSRLKVSSDSIEFEAAKTNIRIAENQLGRMEQLYSEGLKSLTDLEQKRLSLQKAQAELISKENDLLASQNEVLNAKVELVSTQAQYRDKVNKAESDKFEAMSAMYEAEAVVTKLQNQYMNYSVRTGMYYVTAPQNGYITKVIQFGIGETVKEGAALVSVMPADYDLAVEIYVKPIDLPLVSKGNKVRLQFDGWPAIVFSGWPQTSYGTYGGEVFAIDNFISPNGLYRVLVKPDPNDHPWPDALRVGAGASGMMLLKDVFVGYELWRKINGFPPDFYQLDQPAQMEQKK